MRIWNDLRLQGVGAMIVIVRIASADGLTATRVASNLYLRS